MYRIFFGGCVLFLFLSWAQAGPPSPEFIQHYRKADYAGAAGILERELKEMDDKISRGERSVAPDWYRTFLLLGHLDAWKRNQPEAALARYEALQERRRSFGELARILPEAWVLFRGPDGRCWRGPAGHNA